MTTQGSPSAIHPRLTHQNCVDERRRLTGGARDSRAVSGDSPETPHSVSGNTQDFQNVTSTNLNTSDEHTRIGCLRRVAADRTRVACSTRKLLLAAATLLMRKHCPFTQRALTPPAAFVSLRSHGRPIPSPDLLGTRNRRGDHRPAVAVPEALPLIAALPVQLAKILSVRSARNFSRSALPPPTSRMP